MLARWTCAALCALVVSCAGKQQPAGKPNLEVLVDDAAVDALSLAGARLSFPWEVKNLGVFPVTLEAIDWALTVDEVTTRGTSQTDAALAGGASVERSLILDAVIPTGGETVVRYSVNATFRASSAGGQSEYTAEWNGELLRPQPPTVSTSAEAARYPGTIELHVLVAVHNANSFPIRLDALRYTLSVAGTAVTSGSFGGGETIPPGSERQFDFTQLLGRDGHRELADKLAAQGSFDYALDAELVSSGSTVALPLVGKVTFPR